MDVENNKKKKVLFVIESLQCGGAEKSLVSLLPLLDRSKYDICLWILSRGGVFEAYLPDCIHILPQPKYNCFEHTLLWLSGVFHSLLIRINRKIGKREHGAETLWKCRGFALKGVAGRFDIAVAYQQGLPTYLVEKKINAKKKIAWVNCNIFNAGYSKSFNEHFYDKYPAINLVSKELLTIFVGQYPQYKSKLVCIYDILNPDLIRKQAEEPATDIRDSDNKTIIVTTGRLAPPKNHLLAVEAARLLKGQGLDFKWYFVGEGNERNRIEKKIGEYHLERNVFLLGLKTNPYPFVKQCDVYVQSSKFEGFGMTIAEAKILGKPVVSTDFDVVHDQISHEKNGLISGMSATSLAEQIMRMISDDELRNTIIRNVHAEKNMTYLTEVSKVEKLFDE